MTLAEKIYDELRKVPAGKVTTYKALAQKVGTKAYRVVGQALSRNPYAPVVPCHRVVKSDGTIGGFMGSRGGDSVEKKKAMLLAEGIKFDGERVVDLERILI